MDNTTLDDACESKLGRRDFLKYVSAASITAAAPSISAAGQSTTAPGADHPNIVLLYTDDLGYAELGCYGATDVRTPNIDRLASQGMRLTDFCAASPVCTPARNGLLTGRYPHRNGLYENIRNNMVNYDHRYTEMEYVFSPEMTQGLDLREVTIANLLKEAGYRTGIVGKWDGGRAPRFLPLQRGFDVFYGFCNTGVDYWTHERYGIPSMYRGNRRIRAEGYATQLFERETVRFIEDSSDDPFFLYVPFNAPHGASNLDGQSHQAPEEYIAMYGDPPGSSDIRRKANITCMDAAVGSILDALEERGLTENTLVIFTNDHGGFRNEPLRDSKGGMYEGGLRVPFVGRWPGRIPAGSTSDEFCSALDLLPTLVEVAGGEQPRDLILDGYNILPVLTERAPSPRESHFWELRGKRAVRSNQWKWVMETDERWVLPDGEVGELYDLSNDLGEGTDLAEERPEVEREMHSRWESWIREMAAADPRGPFSKTYFDLLGYGDGMYRL